MRFALVLALVACSAPPKQVTPRARKPAVVVLLVIDQFPQWTFEQKLPALKGGFARLLAEGEWHVGRHPSIATITAPGHALLGTGQAPATSGILGNEWWDRESERVAYAVDHDGNSPWLRVAGLGDEVDAVGVSLKARAARLPLGKGGLAIWLDVKTGRWASSGRDTRWVSELPQVRLAPWTPRAMSIADQRAGEVGSKGFSATFPHVPKDFNAVLAMPLGNEVVLATAQAALDHEHPELLVVSLSAHDYVAHGWGHESLEAWDETIRLDESLAHFMAELDRTYEWAMIVTSDHGGQPMPVHHLTSEQILAAANTAASAVLGPGEWIAYAHFPALYLTKAAWASKERDKAIKKITLALRSFPGLARVERVSDIAGDCEARRGDDRALCLAIDPERSGDVIFTPAPGWIIEDADEPYATGHGSLNDYDRNVPVIVLPWGRTKHAPDKGPRDTIGLEHVRDMTLDLVRRRRLSWKDL